MAAVGDGWFQIDVPGVRHGTTYQFVLQDGMAVPDPASRAQQADVNGPSVVIDPRRSLPAQREWQGRPWEETVIYELHIGTFTGKEPSGRPSTNCLIWPNWVLRNWK